MSDIPSIKLRWNDDNNLNEGADYYNENEDDLNNTDIERKTILEEIKE